MGVKPPSVRSAPINAARWPNTPEPRHPEWQDKTRRPVAIRDNRGLQR